MTRTQLFRIARLAWIPVLAFPLYGQSCNRNCPDPTNPCERVLGRSSITGQCEYGPLGFFGECGVPVTGGSEGMCINRVCVATESSVPADPCVHYGMGRINCCSPAACGTVSGVDCPAPNELDGRPCDSSGVEPPDQLGQEGVCMSGECLSGLCDTVGQCDDGQECTRDSCNPATGECYHWPIDRVAYCGSLLGGICIDGECVGANFCVDLPPPGCDDGNDCTGDTCFNDDGSSPVGPVWGCSHTPLSTGSSCVPSPGAEGVCDGTGTCDPIPCDNDPSFCDDGNDCTADACNVAKYASAPCPDPACWCDNVPTAGAVCELPGNPGVFEHCGSDAVCGNGVTNVLTVACTQNVTADLLFLPFELTVDPDLIAGSAAFMADVDGVVEFPESTLDALVAAAPPSLEIVVHDLQATVHLRSGGTGADVTLVPEPIPYSCTVDRATCDPANNQPGSPGAQPNTDCIPTSSFNPCLRFVPLPTSADCAPLGVCEALGKYEQCYFNAWCITGPLAFPLQAQAATYTADASGAMVFGWDDQSTGATLQVGGSNDGAWSLPAAIFANPTGPNGSRTNFSGLSIAYECTMGVDSQGPDGVSSADPLSSPTPDYLLTAFEIAP
jgi:hypothetical protein